MKGFLKLYFRTKNFDYFYVLYISLMFFFSFFSFGNLLAYFRKVSTLDDGNAAILCSTKTINKKKEE